MAATRVFITGATGYIGGSVLNKLHAEHPELEITALLRSPNDTLASHYPTVKVVKGTWDDSDVIEKAAEQADIVIHAGSTDHIGCVRAVLSGLAKRSEKSLLLHLTGTGSIADIMTDTSWIGKYNPQVWNDVKDIQAIYDLPEKVIHREADTLIADANNELVKTISISPPDIYGRGTGPGKKTSFIVPLYVEAAIGQKQAFYFGEGENMRALTHISDVVSLFMLVIDKWLKGGDGLEYGKDGYYFAASDETQWKKAAQVIAKIGGEQGWLPAQADAVSFSQEQASSLNLPPPFSNPLLLLYIWGSNSRVESERAKKLGWEPKGPSFWSVLPDECKLAAEERAKSE